MLKAARAQQREQKEHFLAVQAQRERGDFERVLQAQQELIEKDKVNHSAGTCNSTVIAQVMSYISWFKYTLFRRKGLVVA